MSKMDQMYNWMVRPNEDRHSCSEIIFKNVTSKKDLAVS